MENSSFHKDFSALSLINFAIPSIITMVFVSLYSVVDGMFISRFVSELALSSQNMFYPILSILYGISIMLGTGSSALIAIKMGKGKFDKARELFTFIVVITILIGVLFGILGNIFLDDILVLLGTSEIQFSFAKSYATGILYFAPMLFLQIIFQILLVTASNPKLGLIITLVGGISNIILDYIFMGLFNMGIFGSAIATGIGATFASIIALIYFARNKKGTLYFKSFNFDLIFFIKSCANGSSEMISNVSTAVTTFLFNLIFMKYWAEDGVAAIAILSYLQFVFCAIFIGFSIGVAPIISYKHGATDIANLKKICALSYSFIITTSFFVYVLSLISIDTILEFFTDSGTNVFNIAKSGFYIYALQFLFMGFSIFSSALFTAFGNGLVSAIISISRTFIFLVLCQLTFPLIFDELGIWLSVPFAEFLGVILSISFFIWGGTKYKYKFI